MTNNHNIPNYKGGRASRIAFAALTTIVGCGLGCVDPEATNEDLDDPMSWEEYRDAARVEVDGEPAYVVDWDIAVSLDQLEEHYESYLAQSNGDRERSAVNVNDGAIDVWSQGDRFDLDYCVSDAFGQEKSRMVAEMAAATAAWESVACVKFNYVPEADGSCVGSNPDVLFAVRPWEYGGACAFFPSGGGCSPRTLVIDVDNLDNDPSWDTFAPNLTSVGVLRHEIGHILGLRHEHTRPEAQTCFEDNDWGDLTAYDPNSVMHYQWCNGMTDSDMSLTGEDSDGIQLLYGSPALLTCER